MKTIFSQIPYQTNVYVKIKNIFGNTHNNINLSILFLLIDLFNLFEILGFTSLFLQQHK